jgi:hypothetical protein
MRLLTGYKPHLSKRGPGRPRRLDGYDPFVGVRLPKPVLPAAGKMAAQREISVSAVVREAVDQYLANEGEAA